MSNTEAETKLLSIIEQGSKASAWLETLQTLMWSDLETALRQANNGYWSIGSEGIVNRIALTAQIVGVSNPGTVPIPLLNSGVYKAVCDLLGVPCIIDFDLLEYEDRYPPKPLWLTHTTERIKEMEIEPYD